MRQQNAFSLIEVIFVLVILGIVSSIGSSIIVQVYENYIIQKAVYNASTKTELVANQLVNRLAYRIPGTTISKDHSAFLAGVATPIKGVHWDNLQDIGVGNNFTTIEWIGADNDSFSATTVPLWNGLCNFANSEIKGISSPGITKEMKDSMSDIMRNLSKGEVKLTKSRPAAMLFQDINNEYSLGQQYSPACMGLIDNNTSCIFPIYYIPDALTFLFAPPHDVTPKRISERYKISWSAYSIALEANLNNNLNTLYLYYNYQPWNSGEDYIHDGTKKRLLSNVSSFTFSESGNTIRFKLCVSEKINQDENITICKEKAILP